MAVGSVPGRGLAGRKDRVVAIKKLNNATPESIELLLREFSLLDQVKHRCIVRVFEYIEAHNAVVMEYIHGVNLRQVLDDMHKHQRAIFLRMPESKLAVRLRMHSTKPSQLPETMVNPFSLCTVI